MAEKDVEGQPFVISWLRTRFSFEILKSVNTSIRGSRHLFFRGEVVHDCTAADLFLSNNFILVNTFCDCNFLFKLNESVNSVRKRDM